MEKGNVLKRTLTLMLIFWSFLAIWHLLSFNPSRRIANVGYVIWIGAMAMSFLSFCIIGDQFRSRNGIQLPQLITALNLTQLPGKSIRSLLLKENGKKSFCGAV
jgi:hypothetical protein